MARALRRSRHVLRFIEYMDVGTTNGLAAWTTSCPAAEILPRSTRSLAAGAATRTTQARWLPATALPRWRWGDRPHRLGHPTILRQLHSREALGRWQAPHLPVRHGRARSARPAAQRLQRRRTGNAIAAVLASTRRPRSELRTANTVRAPGSRTSYIGGEDINAPDVPRLLLSTDAARPSTYEVEAVDEHGQTRAVAVAGEHPLTLYVDKHEIVTLMTLGAAPEALALGYLRNQRLVASIEDVAEVQVDWETEAVAVTTRHGVRRRQHRAPHHDFRLWPGHDVRRPDGRHRRHPPA